MYEALKKAKEEGLTLNFYGNNNPVCPHCGEDYSVSEHENWKLYDEGEHDVECSSCDQEFSVQTYVSTTFSTDDQPDEDEDEA